MRNLIRDSGANVMAGDERESKLKHILIYFFEGYFHQDWLCDEQNSLAIVRFFANTETPGHASSLKAALLNMISENNLQQDIFEKMGANFRPDLEGMTVKEWLEKAINIL